MEVPAARMIGPRPMFFGPRQSFVINHARAMSVLGHDLSHYFTKFTSFTQILEHSGLEFSRKVSKFSKIRHIYAKTAILVRTAK